MRAFVVSLACLVFVEHASRGVCAASCEDGHVLSKKERETPTILKALGRLLLVLNPSCCGHTLGRLQGDVAYGRRCAPSVATEISSPSVASDHHARFGSLAIPEDFAALLRQRGYVRPMPVQENAMCKIAEGESLVIHSATGSGKTLAFLVPLFASIQHDDGLRIIIVVPSQELAIQMAAEAAQLLPAEDPKKTRVLIAISSSRELELEQQDKLFSSPQVPQVLVGTPQRLYEISGHPRARPVMRNLQTIVFDEVDLMIPSVPAPVPTGRTPTKLRDSNQKKGHNARVHKSKSRSDLKRSQSAPAHRSHNPTRFPTGYGYRKTDQRLKPAELLFERICKLRSHSAPPLQVISCSATITSDVRRKLGTMIGGKGKNAAGKVVTADPLHPTSNALQKFGVAGVQLPSTIKHTAYIGKNVETMLQVVLEEEEGEGQVLVVVPNRKSIPNEIKRLRKMGLDAIALQEALGVPTMVSKDKDRVRPPKGETLQDAMLNKRADLAMASAERKSLPIIMTNEHSARGMDLKGITLVIVVGLPQQIESYIHVVGRTAREGRKGKAKILLTEPEDCERLAAFRNKLGMKIDEVDLRFL